MTITHKLCERKGYPFVRKGLDVHGVQFLDCLLEAFHGRRVAAVSLQPHMLGGLRFGDLTRQQQDLGYQAGQAEPRDAQEFSQTNVEIHQAYAKEGHDLIQFDICGVHGLLALQAEP